MKPDSQPPDTEQSAQMENPLLAERRRADDAEAELARLRRARVHVAEAPPRSMAARVMGTRSGQLGALAGAIAVIVAAAAPIITAWMDVTKLRAELAAEAQARAALQLRIDAAEAWSRDTLGPWRSGVDAYRSEQSGRDQWRDRVLCRTGNKPAWEMAWTCPVPKGWAALRE
jgi:hypothetical protein